MLRCVAVLKTYGAWSEVSKKNGIFRGNLNAKRGGAEVFCSCLCLFFGEEAARLAGPEAGVGSTFFQKLGVRAVFDNLAVIHHNQAV